jgi:hypothetical protein
MDEFTAVLRAREFVKNASIGSIPVDLRKYLDIIKAECKVEYDFDDDQSGETTVIAGRRCIFINGLHSSERQRFTTLHEIAHVVLELPSIHGHKLDDRALISMRIDHLRKCFVMCLLRNVFYHPCFLSEMLIFPRLIFRA